jgi:4,5-dihydroxyphthalate decarboxylase
MAAGLYMLPWLADDVAQARRVLGSGYWSYGLDGNEAGLATIIRYSFEQGLISRAYDPRELFAPETLDETVIRGGLAAFGSPRPSWNNGPTYPREL